MEETYRKTFIKLNSMNDSLLILAQDPNQQIFDSSQWNSFNNLLDKLAKTSEDSHYLTLKVTPTHFGSRTMMSASNLSIKVYQAVFYLFSTQHDYLEEFTPPLNPTDIQRSGGQVITQTANQDQQASQTQETTVNVEFNQTLAFMTEAITEARPKFKEGSDERKFLDKLKDSVVLAKNTADLIKMIAAAAAQFGISAEVLKQIFS